MYSLSLVQLDVAARARARLRGPVRSVTLTRLTNYHFSGRQLPIYYHDNTILPFHRHTYLYIYSHVNNRPEYISAKLHKLNMKLVTKSALICIDQPF